MQETDMLSTRITAVRAATELAQFSHVVVPSGEDLRYMIGNALHSHERLTALVVPADIDRDCVLVVPAIEVTTELSDQLSGLGIGIQPWNDGQNPVEIVAALITAQSGDRSSAAGVAVSADLPARHLVPLQHALGSPCALAACVLDTVRAVKTPFEIAALSDAASRIDGVHAQVPEMLRAGRTEQDVYNDLDAAIVESGLLHAEFIIVGSGPNGANPHHSFSERVLDHGDLVVIDIGGPQVHGYHSDCTRTYALSHLDTRAAADYDVVSEAHRAAVAQARIGVQAREIDQAAREVFRSAGLDQYFTHRTGHGIGMGLHEPPFIVGGSDTVIEESMTFSIEPGLYRPGLWGMRLEDIVVIEIAGARPLNNGARELTIVG